MCGLDNTLRDIAANFNRWQPERLRGPRPAFVCFRVVSAARGMRLRLGEQHEIKENATRQPASLPQNLLSWNEWAVHAYL